MAAFLIVLREAAEAALLLGILFAYLRSQGQRVQERWAWGGVAVAVLVSMAAGLALHATVGSLEGRSEEVAEGVIAFCAVAVLTWMVFWMASHSRSARSRLQAKVAGATAARSAWMVAAVAFVAVVREGLETSLFLTAAAAGSAGGTQLAGGLAGLAGAALIGYVVYRGGRRFDVRFFFRATGILIILFAAGLLAKGVHEFQEAGLLPSLLDPVWSLGFGDPQSSITGRVAAEVLGWTPSPSLLQVIAYLAYLIPVCVLFGRSMRRVVPQPRGDMAQPDDLSPAAVAGPPSSNG